MKKIVLMCLVALFTVGLVNAQEPRRGERAIETVVFDTNIDCAGCARKVNNTIPYERGVREVVVDVEAKTVTVTFDPTKTNAETLVAAFESVRIEATPRVETTEE